MEQHHRGSTGLARCWGPRALCWAEQHMRLPTWQENFTLLLTLGADFLLRGDALLVQDDGPENRDWSF